MNRDTRPLRVGIIGIGGYARVHHEALGRCAELGLVRIDATVAYQADRYPEEYRQVKKSGARLYSNIGELLEAEEGRLDLVTLPTGISDHAEQSVMLLEAGFHVFCEKPAAATTADTLKMREASRRTGKQLIIGYQHLLTPAIQRIKAIRLNRDLGDLSEIRTVVCWPRSSVYYGRNSWAGSLEKEGRPVYDSPVQNAAAHFLQNMLYVAGSTRDETALPVELYGEQYRAQEIESSDTQFIRGRTADGIILTYAATHASVELMGPETEFIFRSGRIRWSPKAPSRVYLDTPRGEELIEEIPPPSINASTGVFIDAALALTEKRPPVCTIENARQHTALVESLFRTVPIAAIPPALLETHRGWGDWTDPNAEGDNTAVPGIEELCRRILASGSGFWELGAPWAVQGKSWELKHA